MVPSPLVREGWRGGTSQQRASEVRALRAPPHVHATHGPDMTRKGTTALLPLLVLAIVAACAPAHAEIRVGLAAPLTGRLAGVGLAMQRALEAVIAETNAGGGVLGEPVTLVVADDGCAPATAEGAAATLIAQHAVVVIGHPCSSAATAAARVYGTAGVLLISVGARHPDVTRGNATLPVPALRLAGRDDRQGDAAAQWLLAHAPNQRVAIVHDRTAYARAIADGAVAALGAANVAPVAVVPIVAGKHDYGDAVLALKEKDAEAVLFAGYPAEASLIVHGIERLGLPARVLGSDALATSGFADFAAQAETPVSVLLPAGLVPGVSDADDASSGEARGAFEAWLDAARRAGSTDAVTLSANLRASAVETRALGEIRFDANGDLDTRAFAAASARAGRWVIEEK